MKPSQLFRIPWYSAHRSLRWMAVVLLTACAGSAIGLGLFGSKPGHFAGAIFMVWNIWMTIAGKLRDEAPLTGAAYDPAKDRPIVAATAPLPLAAE